MGDKARQFTKFVEVRLGETRPVLLTYATGLAATALALKRVLAWEFQQAMEKANVSQAEMARRMRTSRAVIRRLLDEDDPSITLSTISKAANALGKNLRLKLAA